MPKVSLKAKEVDMYPKFYEELLKDHGYTKKDIVSWRYAGYLPRPDHEPTDAAMADYITKAALGRRHWKSIMGDEPMPYEHASNKCVCKVDIVWNHILIKDTQVMSIKY